MLKLDLLQVDKLNEKLRKNVNKLTATGDAEKNYLYLNAILADTKVLIKHYRNILEL